MPLSAPEGFCVLVATTKRRRGNGASICLRRDSQVAAIIEASDGLSTGRSFEPKPDLVFLDVQMRN